MKLRVPGITISIKVYEEQVSVRGGKGPRRKYVAWLIKFGRFLWGGWYPKVGEKSSKE